MASNPPVVVTGATGFIATWCVRRLLERGHAVRGTVRSLAAAGKLAPLRALPHSERLTLVEADVLDEAAMRRAAEGCRWALHTATPVEIPLEGEPNYSEEEAERRMLRPAIGGVECVLRGFAAAGVRRVVLTSSAAAVAFRPAEDMPALVDEGTWSDAAWLRSISKWYTYAKTEQERVAWRLAEELGVELRSICPPFVVGPVLTPHLNYSHAVFREVVDGTFPTAPNGKYMGIADVRDVAEAHVLAVERDDAEGRYFVLSGRPHVLDVSAFVRREFPELAGGAPSALADPSGPVPPAYQWSNGKVRALGVRITPVDDTLRETFRALVAGGHLRAAAVAGSPAAAP